MKVYKIVQDAGYKGCGDAMAIIDDKLVVTLLYYFDSSKRQRNQFKIEHPEAIKGMCSCWEFCVV